MYAFTMSVPICPWLGSRRDPDTPYSFPTTQNYCYVDRKEYPPTKEIQTRFCLVAEHVKCPLYVAPASPGT